MNQPIAATRARRLLWLAFVLALPLPFYALQVGIAPPIRMLFVGSLILGFFLSAPASTSALFLTVFMGQGLLWVGATRLLAALAVRWLGDGNVVDARRVYAVLAAVFVLALLPVYHLPMSSAAKQTNLFGLFR